MGTLLGNNSKEQKTDKGNRLYEFRRVQSEELQQYRFLLTAIWHNASSRSLFSDNYTDFD